MSELRRYHAYPLDDILYHWPSYILPEEMQAALETLQAEAVIEIIDLPKDWSLDRVFGATYILSADLPGKRAPTRLFSCRCYDPTTVVDALLRILRPPPIGEDDSDLLRIRYLDRLAEERAAAADVEVAAAEAKAAAIEVRAIEIAEAVDAKIAEITREASTETQLEEKSAEAKPVGSYDKAVACVKEVEDYRAAHHCTYEEAFAALAPKNGAKALRGRYYRAVDRLRENPTPKSR
jgi:hypothetical protein